MALMSRPSRIDGLRACVRFINNYQLRTRAKKLISSSVTFDEICRDNDVGKYIEDRPVSGTQRFESPRRAGKNELGVDVEFVAEFALPLLGQVRRAKHGHALNFSAVEKLPRD